MVVGGVAVVVLLVVNKVVFRGFIRTVVLTMDSK